MPQAIVHLGGLFFGRCGVFGARRADFIPYQPLPYERPPGPNPIRVIRRALVLLRLPGAACLNDQLLRSLIAHGNLVGVLASGANYLKTLSGPVKSGHVVLGIVRTALGTIPFLFVPVHFTISLIGLLVVGTSNRGRLPAPFVEGVVSYY